MHSKQHEEETTAAASRDWAKPITEQLLGAIDAEKKRRAAEREQGEWNGPRGEFMAPAPTHRDIPARMDSLGMEIAALDEVVARFEKRLERVLEPSGPHESNVKEGPKAVCEMGSRIEQLGYRVRSARELLEVLEARVQL